MDGCNEKTEMLEDAGWWGRVMDKTTKGMMMMRSGQSDREFG